MAHAAQISTPRPCITTFSRTKTSKVRDVAADERDVKSSSVREALGDMELEDILQDIDINPEEYDRYEPARILARWGYDADIDTDYGGVNREPKKILKSGSQRQQRKPRRDGKRASGPRIITPFCACTRGQVLSR